MPLQLTVTIEDDKGKSARHQIHISYEATTTLESYYDYVRDYVARLDGCIKGRITGASLSWSVDLPVLRTSADWDSDVEEKLLLKLRAVDNQSCVTTIPTFALMDSGVPVDDNTTAWDDYLYILDMMTVPQNTPADYPLSGQTSRGEDLTGDIMEAREVFRP